VSRGHRKYEILYEYTYEQFNAFCKAANDQKKDDLAESALASRMAQEQSEDGNIFKKYYEGMKNISPAPQTVKENKANIKRLKHLFGQK